MKPVQNLFTPRRVPARYERGASSFPPTRGTTGRPCRARHTGFKAVSTGRGTTSEQDNHIPSPLMGEESKVRVNKTTPAPSRHCGLDPQSTGWPCRSRHTGFKAVSTGRGTTNKTTPTPSRHCGLDPQSRGVAGDAGEQVQNNQPIPLSLDGRGIKGEGENDAPTPSRHCGLDPQSTGRDTTNKATKHHLTKIG